MWVVYHKLELSQISNIKEYIYVYLMVTRVVFRPSQNIWLSVQTLKFWFFNMAFLLSPSERLFHKRTEVTVLFC